jgi:hypothetical protein
MAVTILYTGEPERWSATSESIQVPDFASYYPVFYAIAKIFQTNSFITNPAAAANWADLANMTLDRMLVRSNDRYPVDIVIGAREARSTKSLLNINYPSVIPEPEA